MQKGIENTLLITVDGAELTRVRKLELYLRQGALFFQYAPQIVDASTMRVTIPKTDAVLLQQERYVQLQAAWTDADGAPTATEIAAVPVEDFLKAGGYDAY